MLRQQEDIMTTTGMTATGVIVRNRTDGKYYGVHAPCQETLFAAAGIDPLDDNAAAVVIGPLFAPGAEWTCPGCGYRGDRGMGDVR